MKPCSNGNASVVSVARDGSILSVGVGVCKLFGYVDDCDSLIGKSVAVLVPHSAREQHDMFLAQYVQTRGARMLGQQRRVEAQHKDGSVFPVVLTVTEEENGRVFVAQIERPPRVCAQLTVATDGAILKCSAGAYFGYADQELQGQDVSVLVPSPWKERHAQLMAMYEATGRSDVIGKVRNLQLQCKSGVTVDVSLLVRKTQDATGRPVYEVDAEEVDEEVDLFFTLTPQGTIRNCNTTHVVALLGYSGQELLGQPLSLVVPSLATLAPVEQTLCDAFHKDGSLLRVLITIQDCATPNAGPHFSCHMRRLTSTTPRTPGEQFEFPDIVLGAIIGKGSFGVVRVGTIKSRGTVAAVKLLPKNRLTPLDAQLVRREISVVQRLAHANICLLFQVVESADMIGLAMEYCSGGELKDYVAAREKLHEVEARLYYTQIISALSYMHAVGVIHRDVKPQNVLMAAVEDNWTNNRVKLVDFGLSAFWRAAEVHRTFW
jgi:PAS domain S-box-containing protein